MSFTLTKYSKFIKLFSVIPVFLGLSIFADLILPSKIIDTKVVSKKISTRSRFGNTTYKIAFNNNNDQFTQDIYNALNEGDAVQLKATYLHQETRAITIKATDTTFNNDTSEVYFQLAMGLAMLFPMLYWFKKRRLSAKQCKYILIISLISLGGFYRLIKILF